MSKFKEGQEQHLKPREIQRKVFKTAEVRQLLDSYKREEISFSKMVELMNEKAQGKDGHFFCHDEAVQKAQDLGEPIERCSEFCGNNETCVE